MAFQNGQNSSYHLVQTPKSSTYLKQGKAHLRMLISGSMSLAMASSTIMFVSSVANSPSSFILFSRMMVSMSMKMCMPCRSSRAWLFSTLNRSVSCLWQLSNFPPRIFLPSKLDKLQMSSAHSSPRPSMTDLMKLTKFFLSFSLRVMTMPASMTLTTILSLYCLSRLRISCSSCLLSRYSLFIFSVLKFIDFSFVSIEQYSSLIESRISVRKLKDCSLISMKMLPPWQSAWMKLFFISISKKVLDPRRAITLLRGCLLDSQQVTGTPSTKVSMRTESLVFSSKGKGNLIYLLPLNISLKVLRFFISKVKSICSVRVRLRECSLTGISMAGEMKEARQLRKNSRFTSLSMYLSTLGCRTFTATFFPLQMALQTWLTEPDAMGTGSNDSKMSSMFLPQDSLKQPLVVSSECVGAFSRRYSNLEASSGPIMSLLWLRYWKALMKTTPDLSMAFTKRSIQQFCVRLKKSSGESRMGGMKISIRWKKRTTWMKACQILAQIDRPTPTAPSLDGFCSAGPTAAGLSSCRLTFPGMKARQAAAKRGSLAPLRRSWVLKAGRAALRRRDAAKPKLQWKRSR